MEGKMSWYAMRRANFRDRALNLFLSWLIGALALAAIGVTGVILSETKTLLMVAFLFLVAASVSAFVSLCHAIDAFCDYPMIVLLLWLFFAIFAIYAVMAAVTEIGWAIKRAFPKNKNVRHRPF